MKLPSNSLIRPIRWLAVSLVVPVLMMGCGSDDESEPLEQADVIAQGDAICAADYAALADITTGVTRGLREFVRSGSTQDRDTVVDALDEFIANLESTYSQLTALDASSEAEEPLTAYLDLLDQQIEVLSDAREAFAAGELNEYQKLGNEFTTLGRDATSEARDYGFLTCSGSLFG